MRGRKGEVGRGSAVGAGAGEAAVGEAPGGLRAPGGRGPIQQAHALWRRWGKMIPCPPPPRAVRVLFGDRVWFVGGLADLRRSWPSYLRRRRTPNKLPGRGDNLMVTPRGGHTTDGFGDPDLHAYGESTRGGTHMNGKAERRQGQGGREGGGGRSREDTREGGVRCNVDGGRAHTWEWSPWRMAAMSSGRSAACRSIPGSCARGSPQ